MPPGRRAARSIAVFLAASLAAHAAVLVALPPLASAPKPAKVAALELVTLAPAVPEAAVPPAPSGGAEVGPAPAGTPAPAADERPGPMLALPPEPPPSPERSIAAGTPPADPGPAPVAAPMLVPSERVAQVASATRQGTQGSGVTATPPVFNASYLRNPVPHYPLAARRAGEEGTVTLRVLVTRDGLTARVYLEKTSGSASLDNAALEAVKTWRFAPARRGEEPLESWVLVPIVFRLEGSS